MQDFNNMDNVRSHHKSVRDPKKYSYEYGNHKTQPRQQYEELRQHPFKYGQQKQQQLQKPPPQKPHRSRQTQGPDKLHVQQEPQQHHSSPHIYLKESQPDHLKQNQNSCGFPSSAKPTKSLPMRNMSTTMGYPIGANNSEMMGWHVANMDAKLNALFATMSEIYKDTAVLAGESTAAASASIQEMVDPSMFALLQRETTSWDPFLMNEKISQLVVIGSWIFHRTQSVINGCREN